MAKSRYGLPYKGSKNQIAEWIVDILPREKTFVDLFFGGGAVTHCAMLKGKYENYIVNDIDARLPKLFVECVYGKHTVEKHSEWISREEFHRLKNTDAYIALIWSFGNNGKDYLYGKNIEGMKKAYHRAVYEGNLDDLKQYGYNLSLSTEKSVYGRYSDYQGQLRKQRKHNPENSFDKNFRLQSLESLQGLQSLQSLQSSKSLQSLQSYGIDYQDIYIPENAIIYCDIPYNSTGCGKYEGFDNQRFYEWARKQDNIFISEYSMPDDFIIISEKEKQVLSCAKTNTFKATERIYTNKQTFNKYFYS